MAELLAPWRLRRSNITSAFLARARRGLLTQWKLVSECRSEHFVSCFSFCLREFIAELKTDLGRATAH